MAIWIALRVVGVAAALFLVAAVGAAEPSSAWKPAEGKLMTRWAKEVSPDNALPEYPRPQLVRPTWQSLNGLWDYAIRPKTEGQPTAWEGKILVPFGAEAALSGVMKPVGPDNRLWYHRAFTLPHDAKWDGMRVMLNFGAIDWEAAVWVNGKEIGGHRGGYDPFSFDITDALKQGEPGAPQEIIVSAFNPANAGTQPHGKQVLKPGGIMYTATTGIWQTAWLEPVPGQHIRSLRITPDIDGGRVTVVTECATDRPANQLLKIEVLFGDQVISSVGGTGAEHVISIEAPKLWSPESPNLYTLRVALLDPNPSQIDNAGRNRVVEDEVQSYFAMRKTSLGKDDKGRTRMMLNNKFVLQLGPLDQGFWPDGLYTAPTDAALKYDIEVTKQLGFNMCRKHVKVEPQRWYYWCDKLGLLVWQDMPSGDKGIRADAADDVKRSKESADEYEAEWKAIIDANRNHPCIVMWVPFNEGWGQFDTGRIVELTKKWDPTRLVDSASGWTDRGVGDVHDMHNYPGPGSPKPEENRAAVLGEFGGLGLPLEGHTWLAKGNWGYRSYPDRESLTHAYVGLLRKLYKLVDEPGLSAGVYTQTTDVEVEVNGLMTYDREIIKPDVETIAAANRGKFPQVSVLAPTSQEQPVEWRYTFEAPAADWAKPGFDDASWASGPGGFGTEMTPGAIVRTVWKTRDIWLRREITLPDGPLGNVSLLVHHDDDAEVYLNGIQAAAEAKYLTDYQEVAIAPAARAALKPGAKVIIAVHCTQHSGGQYIDVGLIGTR